MAASRIKELCRAPNSLAHYYSLFGVSNRVLLTGHSHQAWPDCSFAAQQNAWLAAAEHVDDKWELAYTKANRVRDGYARMMNDRNGCIDLASSTHDLIVRFLSALPLQDRPRIVTTEGEFHSIRRQLNRLEEAGIEVIRISVSDPDSLSERIIASLDDRTSTVLVSKVLFATARIIEGLDTLACTCERRGIALLIDAYHAVNVIDFDIMAEGLSGAFIVGGGYKYCQAGEGNAFLRYPADCRLRPVITGWFAEYNELESVVNHDSAVQYPDGPGRFAGATYDPTSHFRAAEVFDFFDAQHLTPTFLRAVNQHQVRLLAQRFDALDLDPDSISRFPGQSLEETAGFLALKTALAPRIVAALRRHDIYADYRGHLLRLGPAPYLSDGQLVCAIDVLGEVVRATDARA